MRRWSLAVAVGYNTAMADLSREVRYLRRMGFLLTVLTSMLVVVLAFYGWQFVRNRYFAAVRARPIAPRGPLFAFETVAVDVAQRASPSVAFITTDMKAFNRRTRTIEDVPQGAGSGIVWDEQGHVVTNFHVIQSASAAHVILSDQTSYSAQLVGADPSHDLAVLKIDVPLGVQLVPIPIGTSSDLKVGQSTFAIGNPFGLDQSVTTGIVSALNRTIEGPDGNPMDGLIQTDAAINPGNSGGPLLDSAGRLVGINTAIYSPTRAYAGIGFAIPVDMANRVVPQIIKTGKYQRARLGISFDETLQALLPNGVQGLPISAVEPNSPAAGAGVAAAGTGRAGALGRGAVRTNLGDVITHINDRPIKSPADIFSTMDRVSPGDKVSVTLWNNGAIRRIEIVAQ
jgi:S1-C subfamily serine protease